MTLPDVLDFCTPPEIAKNILVNFPPQILPVKKQMPIGGSGISASWEGF
jgi:hypothetical protein